ncbi:hypothetical protein CDAR_177291 [Caerostris darwini]|uniref:Endonuclease/exonuclease/phosphatase domain-containing protein n=1 Tax=Caerostris darwini TaxID=1538125 RepID=A0AAV4TQK8_9ARAC|nr:hypothetical protein CDAR_177291 [Caerostris darwini]
MDCDISKSSLDVTAPGVADATRLAVRGHVDKYATRTINFLQLNINGIQRKVAELSDILHTNNIYVACLQETKLNHKLCFKIKGYTTIRKDRLTGTGGGLAFLVKTLEVKYIEVIPNFPPHSPTEAQAINILLPEHTITVINAYHPDTAPIDTLFLQDLVSTLLYSFRRPPFLWQQSA